MTLTVQHKQKWMSIRTSCQPIEGNGGQREMDSFCAQVDIVVI